MTMNDDDRDKENDNNQSNLLTTNSIHDDVVDSQSIHHVSPKKKRNRRKKIGYQRKKRKIPRTLSSLNTTTPPPLATSSNSNSISSRSSSCSSSTQSAASSNHTITTRSRSSSSSTTNNNSTTSNIIVTPPPRPIQMLGPKGMKLNASAAQHQRIMISNLYATKYYNKDSQLPLEGRNGIVAQISFELNLSRNLSGTVSRVIKETKGLLDKGLSYDGKKRKYTLPQKRKIQDGSLAQQMLIDLLEKNKYSKSMTAKILSAQIAEFKDNPIGPWAVSSAIKLMPHLIIKRRKKTQADDTNLYWVTASFCFCLQIMVRSSMEIPEEAKTHARELGIDLNDDMFNIDVIKENNLTLDWNCISFWDEMHIKQRCGEANKDAIFFPRNDDGIYDVNGTNAIERGEVNDVVSYEQLY